LKRQVVAIDCDGVIVDNIPVWDRYISEGRCGVKHAVVYDPTDWDRYGKICKECFHECLTNPNLLYVQTPRPDAGYFLGVLSSVFDLWLVTARPKGTETVTADWLFLNGLDRHFVGMVYEGNKKEFCEKVGAIALLEDAAHNLEPLIGSGVHPICWNQPYNQKLTGLTRVNSWAEATKAIFNVASGRVPT
jgi:5'(3')-deoxyribonucleotidase